MIEDERRDNVAEEPPPNRGELIKFGILALVMLGAVVVVALARPLIFGHIVPAIMGEGLEQEIVRPLPPAGEETRDEEAYPLPAAGSERTEAYPSHDSFMPAVGGPEESYPVPTVEGNEVETAVIQYTVRPNDNLTKIAEQHGVTIQEIIALNNIPNPNRIEAGTVLRIPQGE
jgi:hypothetical protein